MDIAFGTKIFNRKTNQIGLLIKTWLNEYADGGVWRLGFAPRSQNFAFCTACIPLNLLAIRAIVRPQIRFATCVDTKGKRYHINLDDISPVDED